MLNFIYLFCCWSSAKVDSCHLLPDSSCCTVFYYFFNPLFNCLVKMPKKKTGQRKKAEKQKLRQKEIRSGKEAKPLTDWACNTTMVRIYKTYDQHKYRCVLPDVWMNHFLGVRQVRTQTENAGILLLLSIVTAAPHVRTLWKSQVHVEDRRLCD